MKQGIIRHIYKKVRLCTWPSPRVLISIKLKKKTDKHWQIIHLRTFGGWVLKEDYVLNYILIKNEQIVKTFSIHIVRIQVKEGLIEIQPYLKIYLGWNSLKI